MKYKPKKEDLVYNDNEYQVYKKDSEVVGDLSSGIDLVFIGIAGIKNSNFFSMFKNKKDVKNIKQDIIDNIKKL